MIDGRHRALPLSQSIGDRHAREEPQEDRAQTRRLQEEAEEAPCSRRRLKLGRSGENVIHTGLLLRHLLSSTPPGPPAASRATAYAPTRSRSRSWASAPSRSCRRSRAIPSRRSGLVGG